jgi:hypothetical protein
MSRVDDTSRDPRLDRPFTPETCPLPNGAGEALLHGVAGALGITRPCEREP